MNLIRIATKTRQSVSVLLRQCSSATSAPTAPSSTPAPAPESDRIHSTDIAFKPNSAGWGYSKGYVSNYDNIFKKSTKTNGFSASANTAAVASSSQAASMASMKSKSMYHTMLLNSFAKLTADDKHKVAADLKSSYPDFF